jgi:hypothetical protein
MASGLYDKAREAFLEADIDWGANDIRAILIDSGTYTVNLSTHQFLSSIPSGARIAVSGSLTSKTSTNGVADAADVTFTAVSGATIEAIVLYVHTGTDATARLICYIDSGVGLPITPNGGDITIRWDNGSLKIFKL